MADEETKVDEEVHEDDLDTLFEGDDETGEVEPEGKAEVDSETKDDKTELPADKEPTLVPLAALKDERRKRQQLKEENENLRGQLPQLDEEPDPLDDPDAWKAYQSKKIEQGFLDKQQVALNEKVEEARSSALEKYPDYQEKEKVFMVLSALNPELSEKIASDPTNSAEFAYETANTYLESLKPSEKEELISETEKTPRTKVPSLATATASASNSVQIEKDDDDDMFEDQTY